MHSVLARWQLAKLKEYLLHTLCFHRGTVEATAFMAQYLAPVKCLLNCLKT